MKKKVLFINNHSLQHGGVQMVVMNIVRSLNKIYDFDILIFTEEKGPYDEEFLSYGGKIIRLNNYEGSSKFRKRLDLYIRWASNFYRIKKVIEENGPYDVVHTNVEFEAGHIHKAAFQCGVPVRVTHTHILTSIPKNKIFMRIFAYFELKLIKRYSNVLIGCSREACLSMYGKNTRSIAVPNAYNDRRFDSAKYNLENKPEDITLIQIASYGSNKNQLFTIEIMKYLVKKYPNAKLLLEGFELEKGYLQQMKEKIREYNLEKNIIFFPDDADSPALLNNANYFIFPSKLEGFGIAPVESQAMGVRCFISDSVPKMCDCGGCVFLPLTLGAEQWAKFIGDDFESTGGKHIVYDCSKFSLDSVMMVYKNIYELNGKI